MLPTFGQEMSGDERDLRAMWDSFVLGLALVPLWSGEVLWLEFDYLLVLATVEMLDLILFLSFFIVSHLTLCWTYQTHIKTLELDLKQKQWVAPPVFSWGLTWQAVSGLLCDVASPFCISECQSLNHTEDKRKIKSWQVQPSALGHTTMAYVRHTCVF